LKQIVYFFLFIVILPIVCSAKTETMDNRKRVLWQNYPQIVKIFNASGNQCTGQFIAPNLILTASHCAATPYSQQEHPFTIINHKWQKFPAYMVARGNVDDWLHNGKGTATCQFNDWMFLLVTDSQYYNSKFYDLYEFTNTNQKYIPAENIGFGALSLADETKLNKIKNAYNDKKCNCDANRPKNAFCPDLEKTCQEYIWTISWHNEAVYRANLEKYKNYCTTNLCDIYRYNQAQKELNAWLSNAGNTLELYKLKSSSGNIIINTDCASVCQQNPKSDDCVSVCQKQPIILNTNWPKVLHATNFTWGGNSGGAYISENKLIGIVSSGALGTDKLLKQNNDQLGSVLVSSLSFKNIADQLKQQYPANQTTYQQYKTYQTPVSNTTYTQNSTSKSTQILCSDGTKPDSYGCCTGETYTIINGQKACCPPNNQDCYPPMF